MATADDIPRAPPNEFYEIRATPGKGYGCFALKAIKRGTRILADDPLLVVSIAYYMQRDIQDAFDKLSSEEQKLYFSLHSGHGQDPSKWPQSIHKSVREHERARIMEQHAARFGKEPSLISIFQTNCMEKDKGAAIFPHAARFNHCCNPNACFTWNSAIQKETIHAMNDIQAGDQITVSYCDMSHERTLRAWELKHYGFVCDCRACTGDEGDETSFANQSAERRFRLAELDSETIHVRGKNLNPSAWHDKGTGLVKKLLEMAALYQEEGEWTTRLATVFLDIALICEVHGDFQMATIAAGKAVQVKKDCQGVDFPDYGKYVDVLRRMQSKLGPQKA